MHIFTYRIYKHDLASDTRAPLHNNDAVVLFLLGRPCGPYNMLVTAAVSLELRGVAVALTFSRQMKAPRMTTGTGCWCLGGGTEAIPHSHTLLFKDESLVHKLLLSCSSVNNKYFIYITMTKKKVCACAHVMFFICTVLRLYCLIANCHFSESVDSLHCTYSLLYIVHIVHQCMFVSYNHKLSYR